MPSSSSASLLRSAVAAVRSQPPHFSPASTKPFPGLIPAPKRFFHAPRTFPATRPLPKSPILSRARAVSFTPVRCESTTSTQAPETRLDRDQVPAYELTFTCKVCSTRSSHRLSKQGYHHGTVLISCPGCKNRHLIADHLKIFSDKSVTIEDLMREKGNLVKRGSLSAEGDVEFWDDGTTTERSSHFHPNSSPDGAEKLSDAAKAKAENPTDGSDRKA